ncbi:TolC family protein, partial [uncultured Tepidimonas sp.]|uniref:TolC family protein n=1 Tax=uncultured Tepidimonas sp. TaxID=453579 RepID=UPI00261C2B00
MRRILLVWRHAAALVLGLAALAPAARAGSLPLAAWEAQALDQALARRLAQAELEQRLHQREAAQALDGARLQAGAGLARAREALTDTTVRRYERGQVQLGVRWPLLGSRLAAQRALDEADTAVAAARLREQDARQAVRTEVRRAYVALAAAQAREA